MNTQIFLVMFLLGISLAYPQSAGNALFRRGDCDTVDSCLTKRALSLNSLIAQGEPERKRLEESAKRQRSENEEQYRLGEPERKRLKAINDARDAETAAAEKRTADAVNARAAYNDFSSRTFARLEREIALAGTTFEKNMLLIRLSC
jgi:hypothetical protein